MPLVTLAQVFQFEKWGDEGVRDAMVAQGILQSGNYFLQFSELTELTPRIEIEFIPAGQHDRQCYILPDNTRTIFNTFDGGLKVTVVTNRGEQQQHRLLCGQVRAALQPISLGIGWQGQPVNPAQSVIWKSEVIALTDIYLDGQSESMPSDEDNLDRTMIPFAVLFNVLNSAWPENI